MAMTMASASSGVMNSLLAKLATLMGEEYAKLKGVRKEVRSLQEEFSSMQALLEKLADMDELDVQAKVWRDQVREMSYDIEDCIDVFMHNLGKNPASDGLVKRTARGLKNLRVRHQITSKIEDIKTRVKEASERRMRYKLDEYTPMSSYVPVDPRVVAMYAEAAGLVGIDARIDEVVKLLMSEEQELKVVSIVGFGGLGKTTLANQAYQKIEGKFECGAFVSVSQKPDIRGLLNKVFLEVTRRSNPVDGDLHYLLKNIREHLKNIRYFIVIDDIWSPTAWNNIKCAFPANNCGSRILTTTRIQSVAIACCSNNKECVYNMTPLDEEDSKSLFFNRIFGSGQTCPRQFEQISANILRRCGGLPLAIISVSSILVGQSKSKWEYVKKSMGSMVEGNPTLEDMMHILDLSYRNLPRHLKTCLLYLGMYPEDYIIWKDDLMRLWIAEGFVSITHGLESDDVAENYFNELINMSMIQPVQMNNNDEVVTCRIHDIVLDLIRSKCIDENFIFVMDGRPIGVRAPKTVRRVSLQYGDKEDGVIQAIINGSLSQVRSVLDFRRFFRPYFGKYMRVLHLDLSRSEVEMDLTGISELFLLRYLHIRSHGEAILKLPSKIGKLQYLETVHVSAPVERLPSDIVDLPLLSDLRVRYSTVFPDGIGRLKSLRTLRCFGLAANSVDNIESLGELTNLRDLCVVAGTSMDMDDASRRIDALLSSLERLLHSSCLKKFDINCDDFPTFSDCLTALHPPLYHLRELALSRCMFSRIPKWIAQLHDLCTLELEVMEVALKDNGVGILAGLPSLVSLCLCINECPQERVDIPGSGMAFQSLKHFRFDCPKPLLAFQAGAMPRLQKLELGFDVDGWEQNGILPAGIEHLSASLREVHLLHRRGDGSLSNIIEATKSALSRAFAELHPDADFWITFRDFFITIRNIVGQSSALKTVPELKSAYICGRRE